MACCNKPAHAVRGPVELLCEACPFHNLSAGHDLGEEGIQEARGFVLAAASGENCLSGARWNGTWRRDVRCWQVAGPLKFLSHPCRQWRWLPDLPQRLVGTCPRARTWRDDVAAVRTNIDLPGESPLLPRAGRALPLTAVSGPVPDVHATRGSPNTQGRAVIGGRRLTAESCQHGQGMKASPHASQIDRLADRDPRKEPVTGRQVTRMCINVDDDEVCRATGNADTQGQAAGPPILDTGVVEGRRMETVTPTPGLQTGAVNVGVARYSTVPAVGSGRLTARSKRVDRPTIAGTPPCQPQASDRALRGRLP